jgi:hypothetical protein
MGERTRCEEKEEEEAAAATAVGKETRRVARGGKSILVVFLLGPDEVFIYFRRFWLKTGVKIVGSPVIQKANSARVGKNSRPVNYRGCGPNTGLPNRP